MTPRVSKELRSRPYPWKALGSQSTIACAAPLRGHSAAMPLDQSLRDQIMAIVGASGCIADPAAMAPYLHEERGLYHGKAALVVRPATTVQVSEIVKICAAARVPIVPQGGNTGLCGGAAPHETGNEIILNLGRMNKIRAL